MRLGRVIAVVLSIAGIAVGIAEEKNGLAVTVTRKISAKSPAKGSDDDELFSTHTLSLSAKNTSIRTFPEGTVAWTILRRGREDGHVKYAGSDTLPPLRPVQSTELAFGNIKTWRMRANDREKFEYEVVISHDGHETLRITSCPNFATLAAAATSRGGRGEGRFAGKGGAADAKPGDAKDAGAKVADAPKVADAKDPKTLPPAPATPVAAEPRKVGSDPAPAPAGFDFFNLGGKKAPVEK